VTALRKASSFQSDWPHAGQIAVHDDAPGEIELGRLRIERKIGHGEIVGDSAAILKPLG
jgi:hypothetical protein